MIGLLLVTHGNLAIEFVAALEHVVGPQDQIETVCMFPDDDIKETVAELETKIKAVNNGKGVIILTDMFGGTPSNLANSASIEGETEALAGINLPMLVKLASIRETTPLKDAVIVAQDAGRKYIHAASALLDATVKQA